MAYRTYDYECQSCGWRTIELFERGEQPPEQDCPNCAGKAIYVFGAPMVMNHAYPDGTKRFANVKVDRKFKRAAAEAKARGDFTTEKEIKKEHAKIKEKRK